MKRFLTLSILLSLVSSTWGGEDFSFEDQFEKKSGRSTYNTISREEFEEFRDFDIHKNKRKSTEPQKNPVKRKRIVEDEPETPPFLDDGKKVFHPSNRHENLIQLVNAKIPKSDILKKLKITESSLRTYLSETRMSNLLTERDTVHLRINKGITNLDIVVAGVKERKSKQDIIKNSGLKNWLKVNRLISKAYKKDLLSSSETAYLKLENTVIGRNGDTKQKIVAFLKRVYKGPIFETKKDLWEDFLGSPEWKQGGTRNIGNGTFAEHIKELTEKGNLDPDVVFFVERCKNKHARVNGKPIRDVQEVRTAFGTTRQAGINYWHK